MDSIIKQVQEACAAVASKASDNYEGAQIASAIRALDLSHLTGPRCACGDSFTEDAMCANCLAAKDSASPLTGWQDISTAPKDFVTEFDGWNGERVLNVSWARPSCDPKGEYGWCISEYVEYWGWQTVRVRNLTHWMPLPAPPKPSK